MARSTGWRRCRVPDWIGFVRAKLGATGLGRERELEIVEELAGHLEDAAGDGVRPEKEVEDWRALAHQIRDAVEDSMYSRLRTFWIPGLITGVLATLALAVLQTAGLRPVVVYTGAVEPLVIYIPWLLVLPFAGAVGAYSSRRAGGNVKTRLCTAVFPCFVLMAPFCTVGLVAIVVALFQGENAGRFALAISQFVGVWIVLPAAALLLGALPFLRPERQAEAVRSRVAAAR